MGASLGSRADGTVHCTAPQAALRITAHATLCISKWRAGQADAAIANFEHAMRVRTPPTGLIPRRPHRDSARPCHICTGSRLARATSALGLGLPAESKRQPRSRADGLVVRAGGQSVRSGCVCAGVPRHRAVVHECRRRLSAAYVGRICVRPLHVAPLHVACFLSSILCVPSFWLGRVFGPQA